TSKVNLNNMLCPAVSDPFHGPFYRVFAICHQLILVLTLGKVFVIIARALKLLPSNNQPHMNLCEPENSSALTTNCRSVVNSESSQPQSTGDFVVDRYDNCPGAGMLNCAYKNTKSCCHSGGDCVSSHTNDHSDGNHSTGYLEVNCGCCNTVNYSSQHIVNGHLMDIQTHEHCRKRVRDLSTNEQQWHSETSLLTSQCCKHNSFLISHESRSDQESGSHTNVSDKEKSPNGHAKSHH
ncbi:unnamed protein product, partial [Candidula unifasciata]